MGVTLSITPTDEVRHLGDPIELVATITAANGTAANPDSVIFREKNPDGTTRLIGASEVVVGTWTAPVALNKSGQWYFRVECTGANAGADETKLHVRRSAFPAL